MSDLSSGATGRELGGRYRLVAPIGIGTSSRVYLAVDNQLRRPVAVKLLHEALAEDDAFLRRFRAEARAAGALSHANIVAVYDWGEDRTDAGLVPYLVTEYLGGGSLRKILDRGTPLSPSQTLIVGLDATRALAHAHRRGLIHRDVKPGNLLFDTDGRLRLADFGLARALAEASWTEPSGSSMGTARYASPEQALGKRLDGRSDVYSLALVLVECVTGSVPFSADTTAGTLALRTQSDLVLGPELGGLRGPLERAGRLDPAARPDADELEIALMAAAEVLPRPEPLPLVATLGETQITEELRLVEGMGVRPLGAAGVALAATGPAADPSGEGAGVADGAGTGAAERDVPVARDDRPVFSDDPSVAAAADPFETPPGQTGPLVRTPIVVAEEHHLLSASRPASFGRVEPLGASPVSPGLPPPVEPKARRPWRRVVAVLLAVALLVGGAAGWWFLIRVPVHEVPSFVGQDVGEVRSRAADLGWELDDRTVVRQDGTTPGEVVAQDPRAGSDLAEGETLVVSVSLGATLVPVPALAGLAEGDARAALDAAGLAVGAVTTANDEQVASGSVVSAAPSPGQEDPDPTGQLPKGTTLDLVVSSGPAPRQVPDGLAGASLADAKAKLAAVQLEAGVTEQYDEAVPAGVVMSAGIAAGTEVERGSAVPLVVSRGPAPIAVPAVAGQSGTAAAAALEAAGFAVAGIEGSPSGVVLATDPPAGELHPRGTAVRIFTRT